MIGYLMSETVTVIRRGVQGRDPLGRPTSTESARVNVPGRLEQRGSTEGDAFVVNSFRAYLPVGTEVHERDAVEHLGRLFEVEGTPTVQRIPGFPGADHLDVPLKYVGEVS